MCKKRLFRKLLHFIKLILMQNMKFISSLYIANIYVNERVFYNQFFQVEPMVSIVLQIFSYPRLSHLDH